MAKQKMKDRTFQQIKRLTYKERMANPLWFINAVETIGDFDEKPFNLMAFHIAYTATGLGQDHTTINGSKHALVQIRSAGYIKEV